MYRAEHQGRIVAVKKVKDPKETEIKHLLDDTTILPNTLPPKSFSTQVSQRLGIRSYLKRIADTTSNINNHNTV